MKPQLFAVLTSMAFTTGCIDWSGPASEDLGLPDVTRYVADAAAAALDARGHFRWRATVPDSPHSMITPERAGELALSYIRTFISNPNAVTLVGARSIRADIEAVNGGPIPWQEVSLGNRIAFPAAFAYDGVDSGTPAHVRNFWGPHYLVPLYVGRHQVMTLAVAAHATDVTMVEGMLRFPLVSGGEFRTKGLPPHYRKGLPVPPEIAVYFAGDSLRRWVVELPRLVQPRPRMTTMGSKWELCLDQPVVVEARWANSRLTVDCVYVGVLASFVDQIAGGLRLRLFAATSNQPETEPVVYRPRFADTVVVQTEIRRRADTPVDFVEVAVVR